MAADAGQAGGASSSGRRRAGSPAQTELEEWRGVFVSPVRSPQEECAIREVRRDTAVRKTTNHVVPGDKINVGRPRDIAHG